MPPNRKHKPEKPVSLNPLGFEEALEGLLRVKSESEDEVTDENSIVATVERWKTQVRGAASAWLEAEGTRILVAGTDMEETASMKAAELLEEYLSLASGAGFDWPEGHSPVGP